MLSHLSQRCKEVLDHFAHAEESYVSSLVELQGKMMIDELVPWSNMGRLRPTLMIDVYDTVT